MCKTKYGIIEIQENFGIKKNSKKKKKWKHGVVRKRQKD